jgi:phage anti-repressor protein
MNFLSFLKKYTLINDEFINDFYKLFDEKYIVLNNSFIINYELLIKWLDIKSKKSFVETLNNSYKKNIDYIVINQKINTHGGNNKKIYMLTSDAAKRYCLMTKSKKGDDIRHYFIEIEKSLFKYQHYIIKGLEEKINKLETSSQMTYMSYT